MGHTSFQNDVYGLSRIMIFSHNQLRNPKLEFCSVAYCCQSSLNKRLGIIRCKDNKTNERTTQIENVNSKQTGKKKGDL